EHLDQVVGDSLGNPWFQQLPDRYLHLKAGGILDQMQDLEHVKRWRFAMRGGVEEDIEIAVATCVPSRPRAEDRELGDAYGLQRGREFAQLADDDFDRNVCN